MFTDRVVLQLKAGKGGNGIVAWRREKYIPKGGPSGGDGGDGGSIILQADAQVYSLQAFHNEYHVHAQDGASGGGSLRSGKKGQDLYLKIPLGTLVKERTTGEILHDFTQDGECFCICKGGKGGKGNVHFKSPTNRTPTEFTEGTYGETLEVELELKLIGDIGLVGFPNAGKSTFLSTVTAREVKIGAYPFTTLKPNIGYFLDDEGEKIIIADIPGIIEGAHKNKGLGLEFLRHIERTHILLFLLDASASDGRDPISDFRILLKELASYSKELLKKPIIVALNKIDVEESGQWLDAFRQQLDKERFPLFEISAKTGQGLMDLTTFLKRKLKR